MQIDHKTKVLERLYYLFDTHHIFWILSGSMSLKIQGVDVEPRDIDILTDKTNVGKIDHILSDYRVQAPAYSSTETYRSYYGIYKIDNVKVEIMGEFQYRLIDGSWSIPNQQKKIVEIKFDEMILPVLALERELQE